MTIKAQTGPGALEEERAGADGELALVIIPGSGEVIDLKGSTTTELADAVKSLEDLVAEVARARQAVVDEVAQRLDFEGQRTVKLEAGDVVYELETNAPTTEAYAVDRLEEVLEELVKAELISRDVARRVVAWPPATTPAKKVYKRELDKLLANPDLARRIAAVRTRQGNTRTLKVKIVEAGR